MTELIISKIEAWACVVPLGQALDFCTFHVTGRKHTVVRVTTSDGMISELISQSRGAPIDVAFLDVIAPICLGQDASDPPAIYEKVSNALIAMEMDGTLGRAWSLMEICLHDLCARAAEIPLWKYLGGYPAPVKVLLVEGYALEGEDTTGFAKRLAQRTEEGYQLIKLEAAHYENEQELFERLDLYYELSEKTSDFILDFAWTWRDCTDKTALLEGLRKYDILWLEDSFPRVDIVAYKALREATNIAVGCGDEASRASDLIALIEENAVDIIRIDASVVGGINAAKRVIACAKLNNIPVSFHEHPEIHEHLVFGLGCSDHVEVFPIDRPFDQVHQIWEATIFDRIKDGYLHPPTAPGLGITLKSDMVDKFSIRYGKAEL